MDTSTIKSKIIARLKQEEDASKLDTILLLLERSELEPYHDSELIATVMEAEAEYVAGKGIPLGDAREIAKRDQKK